jgi:integrase
MTFQYQTKHLHNAISASSGPDANGDNPSFADLMAQLQNDSTLPPSRCRDLRSGLSSMAKILNLNTAAIPADATWLRQRLKGFHPAQAHMTTERFADIKSYVMAALRHYGLAQKLGPSKQVVAPAWEPLWAMLDDRARWPLSRFFRFCTANAIAPAVVNDTVLEQYRQHLESQTMADDPHYLTRRTIKIWNQCSEKISGWPPQQLSQLPPRNKGWTLSFATFPESLQKDVQNWRARVKGTDPLADDAVDWPLDETTVQTRLFHIRMMASALVRKGHDIEKVANLAYLLRPPHFREALSYIFERRGKEKSEYLLGIARGMKAIAKHHVKLPEAELAELATVCKRISPKRRQRGLTVKNRARLRQLDDERAKFDLVTLPQKLTRRIVRSGQPTRNLAVELQIAVALEILTFAPIRIGNLASRDIGRHLIWSRPGHKGTLTIIVDGDDVKNEQDLEHPLPDESARLIEIYLHKYHPLLTDKPSQFLFPGRVNGHKVASYLSTQIKDLVVAEIGLVLSAHNFRHAGAKLFLDERPGLFEVVRRVLGHRETSTALDHYIGASMKASTRQFDAEILKIRRRDPKGED